MRPQLGYWFVLLSCLLGLTCISVWCESQTKPDGDDPANVHRAQVELFPDDEDDDDFEDGDDNEDGELEQGAEGSQGPPTESGLPWEVEQGRIKALEKFYDLMQKKELDCDQLQEFIRNFVEIKDMKENKTEEFLRQETEFIENWHNLYYSTCHPVAKLSTKELYEKALLVISGEEAEKPAGCPMGYGASSQEKAKASEDGVDLAQTKEEL